MLSDCKITVDTRGGSDFAFSMRQIFRWSYITSYASRNVLINSVLQSLGSSTHVPTVTAPRPRIDIRSCFVKGRVEHLHELQAKFSRCKNDARFNSLITSVHSNLGLLFKIQKNFANPRELQVNWKLFWTFFWFTVKKRNFFWHGDLNNAFWISIIPSNGADVFQFMLQFTFRTSHQCSMHKCFNRVGFKFCRPKRIPMNCPVKVGYWKQKLKIPHCFSSRNI